MSKLLEQYSVFIYLGTQRASGQLVSQMHIYERNQNNSIYAQTERQPTVTTSVWLKPMGKIMALFIAIVNATQLKENQFLPPRLYPTGASVQMDPIAAGIDNVLNNATPAKRKMARITP